MEFIKASLDRFEGDYAIVYSDSDGGKYDIPRKMIPGGSRPGSRLVLHLDEQAVSKVTVDERATQDAKDRIKRKYEKLRRGRHLKRSD